MTQVSEPGPAVLDRLARLLRCANQNAALVIEALCSQSALLAEGVHLARPNAGQVEVAREIRDLLGQTQLAQLAPEQIPRFVLDRSAPHALGAVLDLDPRAAWLRSRHPLPPDRYSVHCTPLIHGSLLEHLERARQIAGQEMVESPAEVVAGIRTVSRDYGSVRGGRQVPTACGVANLKAAIAALASISERRLAKLLDPNQNNGLPASLVASPGDGRYGLMILRYRAAALVSELSDCATPTGSTGVMPRRVDALAWALESTESTGMETLCEGLQSVLALERCAVVQALRVRLALFARVHGAGFAPTPGGYAVGVIEQFEAAGLRPIWDGRKLRDEVETVRGML